MVDLLGTLLNGAVTLGAAFGGFALAGRNQRAGDARAAERERAQHARDVTSRLAEERHRDQLQVLRTVQEEVQEVARNTSRIVQWDETLVRESADSSLLPPGLNAEDHDARVRLAMHTSRVLNDDVRAAVTAMTEQFTRMTTVPLIAQSVTLEKAAAETQRRLGAIAATAESVQTLVGRAARAEAAWEPSMPWS